MENGHDTSGGHDTSSTVGAADPAGPAAHTEGRQAAPRVFITYAHEDEEHIDTVRTFTSLLRARGVDVKIDLPAAEQRQDWASWIDDQLRLADYVLVIISEEYRRRSEERGAVERGRGVRYEAAQIRSLIYGSHETWFSRVLPVVLPGHSRDDIPTWLGGHSGTAYEVPTIEDTGIEKLLRVLHNQPYETEFPLGPPPPLPPRPHPGPWPLPANPAAASHAGGATAGSGTTGGSKTGGSGGRTRPSAPPPATDLQFTVDDRWALIDELAQVFSRPKEIDEILDRVGLPPSRRTHVDVAQIRWTEDMKTMTDGAVALPYWKVLVEALRRKRSNEIFRQLAHDYGIDPDKI